MATDADGRPVDFANATLTGGFSARYSDTHEPYPSHECMILGRRCHADEAYMGGIVVQPLD